MATPSNIPLDPRRDSSVRIHRQTRGGRTLWYQLTVLQQPERARACGAGHKANSDRRPVDPPPVVELRIKQGDQWEGGREITFDYNASFFLYASLEQHRKISSGRLQTQNLPPILTGVPASGMAYLDRPTAAGYFIFPDLSVRHEGQYCLSFSLFETTKLEADFDLEPTDSDLPPGVDWRMDIKTDPFDVYSAKKFPGLMESTALSKEVADQGCRVRIRRDVRMRKRESKANGHDRREESYTRRRAVTPANNEDANLARARSMSNSSEHQRGPYVPEHPRRPSIVDTYPHPPPPPQSYEPPSRGHLSFGSDHSAQYAAPRQYNHQPLAPVSPSGPYAQSPQYAKTEPHAYPYPHPPSRSGPTCPSPGLSHDTHSRRTSSNYVPPSPSIFSSEGHARHESHSSYSSTPISSHAPARIAAQPRPQPQPQPRTSSAALKISNLVSHMPPIEPQTERIPRPPPTPVGGKRKHDDVFLQSARPLHNGQRPHELHSGRQSSPDADGGCYKRADGSTATVRFNEWIR